MLSYSPLHDAPYSFYRRQMWTLRVWSHAAGSRAEWGLASSCWNNHRYPKKRLSKLPIYSSASVLPSRICKTHALSTDGPHTITDAGFFTFLSLACGTRHWLLPKAAETWAHLTTEHVSTVFLFVWDELVSRELGTEWIYGFLQFQVTFLDVPWGPANLPRLYWSWWLDGFSNSATCRHWMWGLSSCGVWPWPLHTEISPDQSSLLSCIERYYLGSYWWFSKRVWDNMVSRDASLLGNHLVDVSFIPNPDTLTCHQWIFGLENPTECCCLYAL